MGCPNPHYHELKKMLVLKFEYGSRKFSRTCSELHSAIACAHCVLPGPLHHSTPTHTHARSLSHSHPQHTDIHSSAPHMEQQNAGDAGIELSISIPIYSSDPHFLRATQKRSNREDFRSIKRQARSDMAAKSDCVSSQVLMDDKDDTHTRSDDISSERKQNVFMSSPSSSLSVSSSLSSSVSDLFTFDENDMMEFVDERSTPRFRLLAELY